MKRTNLALVKTRAATVAVQARPSRKDAQGALIISQYDIDRLPDTHTPMCAALRMRQVAGDLDHAPKPRPWWERVRSRLGWLKEDYCDPRRRF